jgi:oxygen-dependent protoporphyrinogen oxidase
LARTGVLSGGGLLRAASDLVRPATRVQRDVAVGAYVRRRVGDQVVDRLVDPLLGGVYAGHADGLSLEATIPALAATARTHRTLLGAARAARRTAPAATGPVFASLRGGLGRLAPVVAEAGGAHIRTDAMVRRLERTSAGYRLAVGATRAEENVDADAVVLALPGRPAARLLSDVAPDSASALSAVDYASSALVTLAFRRSDVPTQHVSGFLVPSVEGRTVKAVTFTSTKWGHLDEGDLVLMRASVGRYGEEHELQRDDDAIADAVSSDLAVLVGTPSRPVEWRVTRWGGGLPQYRPGHLDLVRRVQDGLPAGVAVCGAVYDGVGVPACIRSGREAAATLLQRLRESTGG